jgi:hypothetical protein
MYMVLALITKKHWRRFNAWSGLTRIPRTHHAMMVVATFTLVTFSRIFFRAGSIDDAMTLLAGLWHFQPSLDGPLALADHFKAHILGITLVLAIAHLFLDGPMEALVRGERRFRWRGGSYLFHAALLLMLVLFGNYGEVAFIYFQF